jgi:hypothetical protein
MDHVESNPLENILKAGVADTDVQDAISLSGYPLQLVVAEKLRKEFYVQEEWSFFDSDEKIYRSMDMIAEKLLWDMHKFVPRVRPNLNLIVECKRSDLPFVFFISKSKMVFPRFPLMAGLFSDTITITTDDAPSTWTYSILDVLGSKKHEFINGEIFCSSTFSKCERQGPKLRLSGSEPYNAIVLPLMKALDHFKKIESPPKTALYFDLRCVIGLAVLDAPMIAVDSTAGANNLKLVPWVRVPRHQGIEGRSYENRSNIYAIDIVHLSFLDEYIQKHLIPFSTEFGNKVVGKPNILADGKGFVSGMNKNWYKDIDEVITESSVKHATKRIKGTFQYWMDQLKEDKGAP